MIYNEESLISECEKLAGELAEKFLNTIDENTHNFAEYEFAYRLTFDTLKNLIIQHMP